MKEYEEIERAIEDDLVMVQFLDEFGDGLTDWEIEFVESCVNRLTSDFPSPLTEKQRKKIRDITGSRT